ncbi:MAG: M48 family metalloprotease [Methylophilaceae bacterium]
MIKNPRFFLGILLSTGLLGTQISFPAQALDLGKTLEDIAKQKLESLKKDNNSDANNTDPTNANQNVDTNTNNNPNATTDAKSVGNKATASKADDNKAVFNWKNPSKEEEIALGREISGSILGAAPLVKDQALQKYINHVGRWVASQSERADLPWKFGVIDSNDLNAFSAPGGYVLVTKGLYQKLQNESQLAGVLGHEIAHLTKKHQLKVLQKQQLVSYGASKLAGILAKDNKIANKVIANSAEISARALDKDAEFEADRMGMVLATRAGYEPYGLAEILQSIGQMNQSDNSVALLYKTHPAPDERLTKLGDSAGSQFDQIKNGKTLEKRFYFVKN